jgi:hypothetical protein
MADTVSRVKRLVEMLDTALRADHARLAMTKAERDRYKSKLLQAETKLAQLLKGSGPAVSSVRRQGNTRPAASRARVVQVAMTNNFGRRQIGVKAMCMSGGGISFAFGAHSRSVKRALTLLSKGQCSCGARFHMREE